MTLVPKTVTFPLAILLFVGQINWGLAQNINPMSVSPAESDNSVAAELKSFQLADGYKIELFASEELGIADPCAMRWDEKGRLWVLTIPSYPQLEPGKKPFDKLIILEDRNRDGKADTSYVFADNLMMPLGFELGHGGVYLGEQTELVFLKDTDGDGKADTQEVLMSGFGTHDSHQTINSFLWSPGGELFFSQGHSIYSRVETAWGVQKADRAAIWRYRPLRRQLDNFLDGSTASVNPWGMNFGEWGEMFHKANDPELFYTVPGLVKTAHRALLPPIGKLVIKGSIIEMIRTKHLPDDLKGDFILAGYYNNKIERMRITDDSSGYVARQLDPILSSSSRSFRPIDIKIGPDGALYVLDWYNPIIGHYQASMRHPDRDKMHGRIWRITATGRPLVQPPKLAGQPAAALLDYLKSDEHWIRYQVKRLLAEKPLTEVRPALAEWVEKLNRNEPNYEHHLMEALGVFESHELVYEDLLQQLATGKEPGARAYAAHVAGRWADRLPNPLAVLEPLIQDENARVRLEALVAVSNVPKPEAMALATQVLYRPMDKFLRYALTKTAYALQEAWEPALKTGRLTFKKPLHQAWLVSVLPPSWYIPEQYRKLAGINNLQPEVRRNLLLSLATIGKTPDIEFVLSQPSAQADARLLENLSKLEAQTVTPLAASYLQKSLSSKTADVTIAAIQLVKAWKIQSATPTINTLTMNSQQNPRVRAEGLKALVELKGRPVLPLLQKLVATSETPTMIRLAALQGMSELDVTQAAVATVKEMQGAGLTANTMRDVITPLIDQRGGIKALTAQLSKTALSKPQARLALEALAIKGIDAPELSNRLNKMAEERTILSRQYSPEYVEKLAKAVQERGDAKRGELIYRANPSCAACHALNGQGGTIGPNLSAVGRGLSSRELITEVLWPNQNIKEGYNRVQVETKKGELIQGIKVFETPEVVHIKTTDSPKTRIIPKKEMAKQTETGSLMPTGLLDAYSEDDVRDLIRYLSELGNK
ncbi:putative membrane-bound dehydrogenase-like protein [Larkinella arboricola]|uniref:Putative membrane-bound dehydrogenase-like protein n=1 Tax=Larkinella arboricola TaxID=643671 RepID=A0A327XC19_LARAB|nr:PVC-type heme-binding CxxCH protein [Larkinella arboricola]RAK03182.1 putative membrane-bound dehydrogenase-like protein [Larkinella arboricola]